MEIIKETIVMPCPTDEDIAIKEKRCRVNFPKEYIDFLKRYNAGQPKQTLFLLGGRYQVERFTGIVKNYKEHNEGFYDVGVVLTSLEERICFDEDRIGYELIPIAKLAFGDYVCLDYHENFEKPTVCFLDFENSEYCNPSVEKIADDVTCFFNMLYE